MTDNHPDEIDVLIAGGGMVGAALALALDYYSKGALTIAVAEAVPLPPETSPAAYRPSFDARSSALTYGSRLIFEALGLWPSLAARAEPIAHIHVSQRRRFGSVTLNAAERGWPALGYVVENAWLGQVLLQRLRECPAVHWLAPATVVGAHPGAGGYTAVSIETASGIRTMRASLLAIADGADSPLRRQLGIDAAVSDYRQQALIANVSFSEPHDQTAYERFTDWGPMALLPLAGQSGQRHRAALVWTLPEARAAAIGQLQGRDLLALLQQRFGYRQGRFLHIGERACYPLKLVRAREQVRTGVAVVGNAAHALHPVAGQGFNLALRDVVRLSQMLAGAAERGDALGGLALLQRYRAAQHFDQFKTTGFSDRLTALFGADNAALSLLRGMGMAALDSLSPLKTAFIDHMAGAHPGAVLG